MKTKKLLIELPVARYKKVQEMGKYWWRGLSATKTVQALIDEAIETFEEEKEG